MNTKKCIYRNCGNLSTNVPKLTFFSFPLKDVAKCKLWAQMAGCEGINLKHQYLCGNHFNTIYVSNTPRRTVLLPNAVPYRWDENIDGNDDGNGEYILDDKPPSNTVNTREEILLEPLMRIDDENDIQQQNHSIELLDVEDAIVEEDDGDEILMNQVDSKSQQKHIAERSPPATLNLGGKRVVMVQQPPKQQKHRITLHSGTGDFMGHVTKRQKINKERSSGDQPPQQQQPPPPPQQQLPKVRVLSAEAKKSNKHEQYNNGISENSGNNADIDDNVVEDHNTTTAIANNTDSDATAALEHDTPIDDTANNPDIATFILKGEEFIQMPKRIYLAQRAQFNADLKRYRSFIQNIKNQVNSFN